jgi:hypothetical protein
VVPSNPRDAKGLLISAIEDPDPVIFLEPKRLYNGPFDGHHDRPGDAWSKHELGEVPDGHYTVPLGKAAMRREGKALTVLAYGTMVYVAQAAAEETGIDAEIIDLRTLLPLDLDTIVAVGEEDRPLRVVHEATLTSGFGAELAALVQEHCFYHLEAPVARVTGWDTPYPHAQEWDYFPGPARVGKACSKRWRLIDGRARHQAARCRRRRRRGRTGRMACQGRRSGARGRRARRRDDRQGDGRNSLAGRGRGDLARSGDRRHRAGRLADRAAEGAGRGQCEGGDAALPGAQASPSEGETPTPDPSPQGGGEKTPGAADDGPPRPKRPKNF